MPRPRRTSSAKTSAAPAAPPAAELTNLETVGQKLKIYSLQNLLHAKRTFKTAPPAKLGDVLEPWFQKEIQKPGDKLAGITEVWLAHAPETIQNHARLAGLHRGTLTVTVDSAPVRAQLDMLLRQGLLKQLQTLTKGAVFRVKTAVRTPIMDVS